MSVNEMGFEVHRNFVSADRIDAVRNGILEIMRPYCNSKDDGSLDLDECFYQISKRSHNLKNNCYKLFGKMAALPLLLSDPNVSRRIEELGFKNATIQAYSVFCLEPGNTRNMFLAHQDLRDRTSLQSMILWVPLSSGEGIGGMGCYPGTQTSGPIHHGITDGGKPFIADEDIKGVEFVDLTNYDVGDCVFMDPYLIHQSVANTGNKIRWTAVVKVDSIEGLTHLEDGIHPFPVSEYIDLRTNEERLPYE